MALASKFSDMVGTNNPFDFILAEDEAVTTDGTWIGCKVAVDSETQLPRVAEGRAPVIGNRISEGKVSVEDRDPLSHLVWRQDNWSGGALVRNADRKNDGYDKGTFDAAWGTLAPGIAKNYGSDRGNTRQPIGWLLLNPHFESDSNDGWTDHSGGSGTVDMQATDDFRSDILGSQSCKITWTGTTADVDIISQSLANPTVYRGRSLTVSCYFKKSAGSGGVQLEIADGIGTTRGTGVTTASDWTLVTVTRTIDASATEVTITLETENISTFTGHLEDFTVYSGSDTLDPVGVVAVDNGEVYIAAGRIVAKLAVGTTDQFRWDAVYVHASTVATDIIVFRDGSGSPSTQVYVAWGAGAAYIYGADTTWTVSTLTSTAKNAINWAVSRNTLWKSESANTIRSSTNPLNGGSWSGTTYTVGDSNRAINEIYSYDDTVYPAKENGLNRYRRTYNDGTSADEFENITDEFTTQPNDRHFKGGSKFVDGMLYLPLGRGGLVRLGRGGLQDISHVLTKPDAGINGVVYAMAQDTKNLWTFVDDRLLALLYTDEGRLVAHTRGDQPSVSPSALAASETTTFDTGWVSPGTAATEDTGSDDVDWTNPGNITASDSSFATWSGIVANRTTYLIKATNFSFSLPSNAEIVGIEMRRQAVWESAGGGVLGTEVNTQLRTTAGVKGDNQSGTTWDSNISAYKTTGSSSDLWGATWSVSEINDSGFGVGIRIRYDGPGSSPEFRLDHVQLKIHYTITPSSSRALLPKSAAVVTWDVSSVETPHLLGVYGGQEATDNEPYLITDCWALPDEGVAPVLDSSDSPASPTTHTWHSSRWSADAPTELKVASHIEFKLKNMDSTQPLTVKFGTDEASLDSVSLGTLNSSDAVQTLRFGDVSSPQMATLFHNIGIYLEGAFTGSKNKREVTAFELHAWPIAELLRTWELAVQVSGAVMGNGAESVFGTTETIETLTKYEDSAQAPYFIYLIEDFDGDGEPTSTPVAFRPGSVQKQLDPIEDSDSDFNQIWTIVLQETLNKS